MKTKTIKTKQVYSEKNQEKVYLKRINEEWHPINFQWIPVFKLKNELNLKTNDMKNLLIIPIALVLTLLSSCTKEPINGSGYLSSENRNVANFTKVSSDGVFEVTITQGTIQSVEIIADNNIINKVITNVVDSELRLYLDDDYNYTGINLQVNIVVPSINGIKNSGVGTVSIFDIDTQDNFDINNSGSGNINMEGSAKSLTLKNEGSGRINGFQFAVDNCNVNIIGSGDCKINCTNNLYVRIEGSGNVYYKGNPTIDVDISGSGQVVNDN